MNERQSELLKIIVENYIDSFKPVSSNSLVDTFKCSSATIRNDMALLENLGYIEKEHTSSGRIPSEAGYKYYVDHLMKPKELTGEDVLKLQTILSNNNLVISDAINKCMEIISDITHYTSVVIGPSVEDNTLQQISIIPLDSEEKRVVAILVTNTGVVENKQVNIPDNINLKELIKTSELINRLLVGTPLTKVNERLELDIKPRIKDIIERYEEVCHFFSSTFYDFAEDKGKSDVFFSGKMNMLNMPEYQESDKLKEMISKLENTDLVKKIKTDNDDIEVFIGEESEFDPDVTIIKTHYSVGNDEGTLAIIGPKRMEYNKVVTLLNYIKEYIDK